MTDLHKRLSLWSQNVVENLLLQILKNIILLDLSSLLFWTYLDPNKTMFQF